MKKNSSDRTFKTFTSGEFLKKTYKITNILAQTLVAGPVSQTQQRRLLWPTDFLTKSRKRSERKRGRGIRRKGWEVSDEKRKN